MAQSKIRVWARTQTLRGQRVAGVVGTREYYCNPTTGLLHLLLDGVPASEAGVHPDDAARYRGFGTTFEVEKRPPPAPSRNRVKRKGRIRLAEPPAGSLASDPVSDEATSEPDPLEAASSGTLSFLPNDDALTIREWLALADAHGIKLTKAEREDRPKANLIANIRRASGLRKQQG